MNHTERLPLCSCEITHQDAIEKARKEMPQEKTLCKAAELFKVFGDNTRIHILSALHAGELCVCDISALLNMTLSAVSHQLRILRQSNLVRYRKKGKEVFYSLNDSHVEQILALATEHVNE
jgi:ArsR family transcriptional regulator